ncbi:PolC-type DNA polymerase III [Clostridium niameyense]|uniref:DNA polymerase III PolC-type n=1 Tax=Clostridium niameyense TaxID=1622073 RepID=A0A6M0R7B2_9CLOT|nr:PolC-type DNA polymerase III [Clostridium niameyense]NEZ46083.1 PolC-type DNA polymerase III [Clostridium niameyense]
MRNHVVNDIQQHINYNELLDDNENTKLIKVQYFKKRKKLKIIIKSKEEFNKEVELKIKKSIKSKIRALKDVEIVCYKDISNISLQQMCNKYWLDLSKLIWEAVPIARDCLLKANKNIKDNTMELTYGNEFLCKFLHKNKFESKLKYYIESIFGIKANIILKYDPSFKEEDYFKAMDYKEKSIMKNIIKENKVKNKKITKTIDYNSEDKRDSSIIYGRSIKEDSILMSSLSESSGVVVVCGDVFKKEVIETKTGRKIVTFFITDYTNSMIVKFFPRPKDADRIIEEIKEGIYLKVRGEVVNDPYARECVIMAKDIVKTTKIEKMDASEEKRVELHMHTQMSAMDGMSSAENLIKRAAKWGHKAVAITDHGVVQAYPEAMSASKKYNIKIIYGIEAYLVNDGVPIVEGEQNETIDDTFVVFDLETTGFSSENDKIIEIGAVKIQEGKIIDKFSTFVNPKMPIPNNIIELTNISDDMVENSETIENILPKFMNFIKDSIVVAHNAAFDVSFIRKSCKDLNIKFGNPVMDTVILSRYMFPELKRFKLNVVAKHLGISLENHHRAVEDARATGDILLKCFEMLKEREITDLKTLNKKFLENINIKKEPTHHLIILVKNQIGLKNLYKLVSTSNLEYFFKRPRMPKSLINKYREGLIIGSACEAGEIYKEVLRGKTKEELKALVDFYDYLEIQPLGNNEFMLRNGMVKSEEELIDINKRICELGKFYNKPVVATCDVHFLDPEDEIFRKVLMAGQGFSDADNQPPLYFRTTEEMLKEFQYLGEEKAKEVVIYNTNKIAESIEDIKPIPDETFPPKIEGSEEEIKKMTLEKAHSIYGEKLPKVVEARINKELNSIINNGYAVLYLIAHKLVAKSYSDGYLVGSRGSVGSSLVATMCDITEVNGLPPHYVCSKCKYSEFFTDGSIGSGADLPDKNCPKCGEKLRKDGHDIPFETFLGFEGDKEPDIDLNFSGEYQGVVHKYTEVLFGKGHVFKAGTIGTIAEKTAYGFVKKYLDERNIKANSAEIERLSKGCTGVKRTTGQHPGGIMVVPADNEIFNFTPIQHPADDAESDVTTTHFDYHSISGRLLKLDILGHDDPTVLRMLQDLTGVNPKEIPLGDSKVISLFTSPKALNLKEEDINCPVGTYGLPEFGTKFVRQMLVDTKPKTFADLVRISGLSHGTDVWLNNAQYFIKEGYTTIKDCISTRDDIMMYLLQKNLPPKAAFTIMEKVRKGKGLTEEREELMKKHDVPDWYIESCKRIKYMFPKGHAVAYVMMAIRIAYFKVYYPKAYYATYFTVRADDFDADLIVKGEEKIKEKMDELYAMGNNITQKDKGLLTTLELSYEMYKRGIKFLKVDLYKSDAVKFSIEGDFIRPPLSALQGVGKNAAKSIVEARQSGSFISKEDLRIRSKVTKTVIETLQNHGCLRGMQETNQISIFNL